MPLDAMASAARHQSRASPNRSTRCQISAPDPQSSTFPAEMPETTGFRISLVG